MRARKIVANNKKIRLNQGELHSLQHEVLLDMMKLCLI